MHKQQRHVDLLRQRLFLDQMLTFSMVASWSSTKQSSTTLVVRNGASFCQWQVHIHIHDSGREVCSLRFDTYAEAKQ